VENVVMDMPPVRDDAANIEADPAPAKQTWETPTLEVADPRLAKLACNGGSDGVFSIS
jgi:hypothetical protein